eukprot:scaffold9886_cov143-Skeletonema_menzelii.AAC.9
MLRYVDMNMPALVLLSIVGGLRRPAAGMIGAWHLAGGWRLAIADYSRQPAAETPLKGGRELLSRVSSLLEASLLFARKKLLYQTTAHSLFQLKEQGRIIALNQYDAAQKNVGFLSLSLHHCERASTSFERVSASFSPSADTASFQVSILDKHQNVKFKKEMKHGSRGWNRICARSIVLDQPNNFLDDIGTLAIVVSSKNDAASSYVPSNPMSDIITGMFLDEDTADVRFEVSCASADSNEEDGDETTSSPVTLATFHAHRSILKGCAPMLALLFGTTDEKIATASITDVEPDIFHHMLYYVYGGSVPDGEMNAHAKKIIDAADKYSIVNLKLAAETAYVKSTEITMENAVDILLYADALNLALLKEVVIDFLVENSEEATEKISFADVSGTLMKDLLVAISREKDEMKGRNQDGKVFTTMRVSELRAKLAEIGLGVDGSRESMIKALEIETNNSLF